MQLRHQNDNTAWLYKVVQTWRNYDILWPPYLPDGFLNCFEAKAVTSIARHGVWFKWGQHFKFYPVVIYDFPILFQYLKTHGQGSLF